MKSLRIALLIATLVPCLAYAGAGGYVGVKFLGDKVAIDWDSFASTGASSATTGLATGDLSVYKQCATTSFNLTKRASSNGYSLIDTDGQDIDSHTGFNGVQLDTADNTTAGFWQAGCDYFVNIDSITIDSQTVRLTARFSLDPNGLWFGTLSADSASTSTAKVGTTGITFANQYVARVIWNVTTNERQCITSSTDASPDVVTFSPNVPTIWHTSDVYRIVAADTPCYPVTLPAVSGAGGVYIAGFVSAGVADVDSDIGRNHNVFFKNGGATTSLKIDDISTLFLAVPGNVWGYSIDGYSAKCTFAWEAAIVGGTTTGLSAGTVTYKDPSGNNTRWTGSVSSGARSGLGVSCPP